MSAPVGEQMSDLSQAIAQAGMLGEMRATLATVQTTSQTTLDLVRDQGKQVTDLRTNDAKQDSRLDGHDREFGEVRTLLAGIDAKLDGRGLTWPKLLAGGAALAAIIGVAITAIVAVSNGLTYLAQIVERVG